MAKKIKIDKEFYEILIDIKNNKSTIDQCYDEINQIREQMYEYRSKYFQMINENRDLHRENALLKKMFEEAEDTQVIKYNGKLFSIRSVNHYKEQGVEETLDIDAICSTIKVGVNEDGEG